ncbi:hypothetical protein Tco_1308079, partial [Tanacetum coccineum]
MSLSEYYHECNALWRQFDSLVDLHACTCETAPKVKKHSQLLRLMQFLMGLDDVFRSVRSLILTTEPLPDVKQIGSYKLGNDLIIKDVLVVPGYHDLTQKFLMGTGSERGGLYFFDEDDRIRRSNDPYDDGGDTIVTDSKTVHDNSTNILKVITVDDVETRRGG